MGGCGEKGRGERRHLPWVAFLASLPTAALAAEPLPAGPGELRLSGFLDVYHVQDLDQPPPDDRPSFLYNHTRTGEVSVNLALLHLGWEAEAVRARLGWMAGTYPAANLAHEPPLLRPVYEANVGLRIADGLWLDAGVLPSHIGFESALSIDNLTLTRSLQAENSPYYLSGVRLSWELSDRLQLAALLANGWQVTQEPPGDDGKGGGTQLSWKPGERWTLNWSTWVGNDRPQDPGSLRLFSDSYALWSRERVELALGIDLGLEGAFAEEPRSWGGAVAIGRVSLAGPLLLGARVERYLDADGVILSARGRGFGLWGASSNLDYRAAERVMARLEARMLWSGNAVFLDGPDGPRKNLSLGASLAAGF